MRRASYTPLSSQTSVGEPLIVVEESGGTDDEESPNHCSPDAQQNTNLDFPLLNPELLSPYRDMRKRSLPTPSCKSGITASQVRRHSDHGLDNVPSPRKTAFFATLSSAPGPSPGGRRHSVVTISQIPPQNLIFGRERRESFSAYPTMSQVRILPSRRESLSALAHPPSTSTTNPGGNFNLALDIMDNIANIKAVKRGRLKPGQNQNSENSSEQKDDPDEGACAMSVASKCQQASETSPDKKGAVTPISRRYSDLVSTVTQPAQSSHRRASEQTCGSSSSSSSSSVVSAAVVNAVVPTQKFATKTSSNAQSGIVCTNNDLISILNSLASSAQEINLTSKEATEILETTPAPVESHALTQFDKNASTSVNADQRRNNLKNLRSKSFDISILLGTSPKSQAHNHRANSVGPANWFTKRHQPKESVVLPTSVKAQKHVTKASAATYTDQKPSASTTYVEASPLPKREMNSLMNKRDNDQKVSDCKHENKVVWDEKSVVDAQFLGIAIEDFLARRGGGNDLPAQSLGDSKTSPCKRM